MYAHVFYVCLLYLIDLWSMVLSQDTGSVLLPVIQGYLTLMKCVSSSVVSVTQIIQKSKPLDQLFDVCLSDEFIMAFERLVYK